MTRVSTYSPIGDSRPWCFVLEVTPVVTDLGELETFLFSNHAWATSDTDTPPKKKIRPYLTSPGTLRRGLFDKGKFGSGVSADYGSVVLSNPFPNRDDGGRLDDWADYGISGSPMTLRWGPVGGNYPAEFHTVWTTFGSKMQVDVDKVTIWHRDYLYKLDAQVITDGFLGTGGLEGTGSVPKRKQFVSQDPGFIVPILVDRVRQIYFVQSTSDGGLGYAGRGVTDPDAVMLFDVFINAVRVDRASSDYASSSEILSSAPAEGEVKYWFGGVSDWVPGWNKGPVYFRLGSPAGGDIRVFAYGAPNDEDHALRGSLVGSFFAGAIALRAGIPAESIDLVGDQLSVGPQLEDGSGTFADLLEDACKTYHGFYYVDRGIFRSGYLKDPDSEDYYYGVDPSLFGPRPSMPTTEVATFYDGQLGTLSRQPISGAGSGVWSVDVQSGKTWPSQIAGAATDTMQDYLTREVWTAFQGVSVGTKLMEPGAEHVSVQIRGRHFQSPAPMFWDRQLWLNRFFVLYGGRRAFYTFTLPLSPELLDIKLHDVVKLVSRHFNLSAGKKFRVAQQYLDLNQAVPKITFTVWGGTKGVYSGAATPPADELPSSFGKIVNPLPTVIGYLSVDVYAYLAATVTNISQTVLGLLVQLLDPYFSYVVLLCHCEEDATGGGSPTPSWKDDSGYHQTLTTSGTITATATSPAPLYGTKSMVVGASGKVTASSQARNNVGTKDVTVECSIYITSTPSFERLFNLGGIGMRIWFKSSTLAPTVLNVSGEVFTASALSLNTLYNLRLTKVGTTYTLYANGTQIGTGTKAGTDDGNTNREIDLGSDSGSQPFVSGVLDEFRVTIGVARTTDDARPFPNA